MKDPNETIKSATKALRIYKRNNHNYHFKLMAVVQGKTLDDYLKCYEKLQQQFDYIAVGGLLKKKENSARYVSVQNEKFMYDVLKAIKKDYSPDWLFPLGCYHPSRHKKFEEIGVWGSDYKGWIFNYTSKIDTLKRLNNFLVKFNLQNGTGKSFKILLKQSEKLEIDLVNLREEWRKEKDPSNKRKLRTKLNQNKIKLEETYAKLLKERQIIAKSNYLPVDYKENLLDFERVIELAEQEWRFKRVRTYIEDKVYAQLR